MNLKMTALQTKAATRQIGTPKAPLIEGQAVTRAVTVRPVVNAISILRHLANTGAPERAADIARHLSINSSTCFNILRTLVAEDVVDFNPLSKTYSAGLGMARLVEQLVTRGQRIELAAPLMHDLAAEFGVTVTLWRRLGSDRIVLVKSESSPTNLHINMPTGQRLPLLMGASGRLFTGRLGLNDEEMLEAFNQIRWARPISFESYLEEVNLARRRGWACDDGYFSNGVLAIAAPVCDASANIVFTVSTVMIRGDRSEAQVHVLGEAVRDLGHQLESKLF
ncbi:MAG: iclR helix-turn-helix domain protein [Polaromonas sp.]|jgi:DNA-binding IclR family transcriptional regulator|nr:iclR helix-turn-helix domain protein [Polaromonas sp.]